jgi:hypothetical protein
VSCACRISRAEITEPSNAVRRLTEVRDMRGRLALLGTSTALVLGAAVAVAAPAEARNIGGSQISAEDCVTPNEAQYQRPNADLPCVCAIADAGRIVRVIGRGPSACPTGVLGP